MIEPLLKPSERKKLTEALSACARCEDRIRGMEECGIDCQEDRARVAALKQKLSGALAVDEAYRTQPGG